MSLREYFNQFHLALEKFEDFGYSESIEIKEDIRANKQAVISAAIVLINGSSLIIKEFIDGRYKIDRLSYTYHFQDSGGNCLFRYDNAVHKPALGFAEHKHNSDGSITESILPEIAEIVDEVIKLL